MNTKLKDLLTRMEKEHKQLFKELRNYPDDLLNKKPAPDAWSAAQVIEHLIAADDVSLQYLRKKAGNTAEVKNEGLRGLYKSTLLKIIFMLPIKFKVPAVVAPSENFMPLTELEERWKTLREGFVEVTTKLTDKDLERGLWKHTRAGKMNIYQMFDFLHIHFKRHEQQIERTIQAVK